MLGLLSLFPLNEGEARRRRRLGPLHHTTCCGVGVVGVTRPCCGVTVVLVLVLVLEFLVVGSGVDLKDATPTSFSSLSIPSYCTQRPTVTLVRGGGGGWVGEGKKIIER